MRKLHHLVLLTLLFAACAKEEPMSDTPEIALKAAGPDRIEAYTDSVFFQITYEDGDGDLGSNDPLKENLFVRDTRMNLVYGYRIQELVPNGASVPIKGELHFSLPNTVINGSAAEEPVTYEVWVEDDAGHKSNTVKAGPFTVFQ